ncbi:hypothetical protein FQN57_002687 [Myotisia sp. PD_48]|nr:hypothetical protein FQN57_002687 [Myotisia sp. PD_48]
MDSIRNSGLLGPVIALNGWTFAMEAWMYATRIPAIKKYKIAMTPNNASEEMNTKIPPSVRWKADNYNHLFEQPTQFYAVALALAVLHGKTGAPSLDSKLAWAYVGLRVAHSLVQSTTNNIMRRFGLFLMSSGVLAVMTARAARLVFAA